MTAHKLRLAALSARTRRLLRHTADPVERALALVIIARTVADHAAHAAVHTPSGDTTEVVGTERVLTEALEHLHAVRNNAYPHGRS